ncbi:MAG: 1-deoxy-D-xylulose-5-phosphate synthase, partial [Leptospira sp.]|nr:1-deoxy-D-xylulose-5-phosphate synthase [Leptospira sp.]
FPEHTFDVGIAEQHSVAFAAAMTDAGVIPFMCIYSTFLTRALDQLVQDVSLMNLPVRFVIDRAGCVGPDGETHQGLFDVGFLCAMPNMSILAPSTAQDLANSIRFMETFDAGPIAVRFPKGSADLQRIDNKSDSFIAGRKAKVILRGKDIAILSVGSMLEFAIETAELLKTKKIECTVIDLVWIRPLDLETIEKEITLCNKFIILDESYLDAGVSGYLLTRLPANLLSRYIKTFAFPPESIPHGDRIKVLGKYGMDTAGISNQILSLLMKY